MSKIIQIALLMQFMLLISILTDAQTFDIKHVDLDLHFNLSKKQVQGIATMSILATDGLNQLALDAGQLTIDHINIFDSISLQYNYDGGDKFGGLNILLNKEYLKGDLIQIQIIYKTNYVNLSDPNNLGGSLGKGLRFFSPTYSTPQKQTQVWSGPHNRYWFPCIEDVQDIYTTSYKATLEKQFMFIANGELIKTTTNPDNTITYYYNSNYPHPNYLNAFVIGNYATVQQNLNHIQINHYCYPYEVKATVATTQLIPDMIQFMSKKTNTSFPNKHYHQVMIQDYPFPGIHGFEGLGILSENYIDDEGVHEDFKYLWDGIAMQSIASQWFGNAIMPKTLNDIWLNNAFVQYFAGMYTSFKNSRDEYLTYYLPFEKTNTITDWNVGYKRPIVAKSISDIDNYVSDNYSTYRGALVLHMLQKEIGEANWWKAIQLYVKNNINRQVNTQDFQQAIEQTTGQSYQWFFDQWINKIGLPKFLITKKYDAHEKQLHLYINQTQEKDTSSEFESVEFFKGKIDIQIDKELKTVNLESIQENHFVFNLETEPRSINIDPEETWICEKIFNKELGELINQLEYDPNVLGKISAIDQLASFCLDSNTSNTTKNRIIEVFIIEVLSKNYWRYRTYVLSTLRRIMPLPYDASTLSMLLQCIQHGKSWLKTSAITMLGNTKDTQYVDLYIKALHDKSDRVINAAAIALGKTKSEKAFNTLLQLDKKPSWKNQSRISALNGFEQLNDLRATDFALACLKDNTSARWYLATPIWDYPYAAAKTLAALGQGHLGYPIVVDRIKKSIDDNDLNDLFQQVQLMNMLADERGKEVYELLYSNFKNDSTIQTTIHTFENEFLQTINK